MLTACLRLANFITLILRQSINRTSCKDKGIEFLELVNGIGKSREMSLAVTKIEEAVVWAVKHVTA